MHNLLQFTGLGDQAQWKVVGSNENLENLLTDPTLYLSQCGRINVHYTCHHVTPDGQRSFKEGEWLFFDVDHIENYKKENWHLYQKALSEVLGIDPKYIWVINSGHGVHLLIKMIRYSIDYLETHKSTYSKITLMLLDKFKQMGLTGELDPVFHQSKSLRLPHTLNRKENMEDVTCDLAYKAELYCKDLLTEFRLTYDSTFSIEQEIKKRAVVLSNSPQNYALGDIVGKPGHKVNTIASKNDIMKNCSFMSELQKDLAYLGRDQWLKGVTLLATLNMEEEAHLWSSNSPNYKYSETQNIIESAKEKDIQPTSCDKIIETFPDQTKKCSECPFRKFCKSPAKVHDDPVNQAAARGFYTFIPGKNGEMKRGPIDYKSCADYCNKHFNTTSIIEYREVYSWNDSELRYEKQSEYDMAELFYELITPKLVDSTTLMTKGFNSIMIHHKKKEKEFLPPDGYIPLTNGWLNCRTGNLEPYTPDRFVTDKIPIQFDPTAKAPNFSAFLEKQIGDKETIKMLLQYICYALAGIKHPNRRILVLEGPPGTGKSTVIDVFSALFGEFFQVSNLKHLSGRFELSAFENKRLVYFDEAPAARDDALIEQLKNLSGSPHIRVEKKGEDPVLKQNYARMVISCNTIPRGGGLDAGFMDRLLIIPMHNQIEQQQMDAKESLYLPELSGILNLVLDQYKELSESHFNIKASEVSKQQSIVYQIDTDPVAQFFDHEIEFVKHADNRLQYIADNSTYGSDMISIKTSTLRKAFINFCKEEGHLKHAELSAQSFKARIENLARTYFKTRGASVKIVTYARYTYLTGVRFVNSANYRESSSGDDRF